MSSGLPTIPSTSFQLELRSPPEEAKMETTNNYPNTSNFIPNYQNTPIGQIHAHHILNIHNHRSLTNSPISNPGSPGLDMIQEEGVGGNFSGVRPHPEGAVCHPQISVTGRFCFVTLLVTLHSASKYRINQINVYKHLF